MYDVRCVINKKKRVMDNRIFLLCRSTEKVYAQRMLDKGSIFFNYPINWIKKAQEERKEGQGDLLEGVYAEDTAENRKLRHDYEQSDEVKGKIFLRSKNIVNKWLCTCFYSVSDGTLAKQIDGTLKSEIDESYVKAFNKGNKHEPFQKLADDEKMETVVIKVEKQKINKIDYLLKRLRMAGKILNETKGSDSVWSLGKP